MLLLYYVVLQLVSESIRITKGVGFELLEEETQQEIQEKSRWCYHTKKCNDKTWNNPCNYPKYGQQSPINLPGNYIGLKTDYIYDFPRSDHMFEGYEMEFIGNTLHVVPTFSEKLVSFNWKSQKASYYFHSLHFHWGSRNDIGSEHAIQSRSFPVEVHLVYFHSRFSHLNWALHSTEVDAIAVVAVFLTYPYTEKEPTLSHFLYPIIQDLSYLETSEQYVSQEHLNLGDIFPGSQETIAYSYLGSFTSPPCTAIVRWLIFRQPLFVPFEHIKALWAAKFKDFGGNAYNFRSLQTAMEKVPKSDSRKGRSQYSLRKRTIYKVNVNYTDIKREFIWDKGDEQTWRKPNAWD